MTTGSSASNISFNNWGGLSSLSGFDDFFGSDNFDGGRNEQVVLVEQQVCRPERISIIQQQLAIIHEVTRQIISQQICDVETQVIVLEQHRGRGREFKKDLRRKSGRNVGYDANIALLIHELMNQDGSLNNRDLGFRGSDIGKHLRVTNGNNWDDNRSPQSIDQILLSLEGARNIIL
ncbi:hypothetical protein GALMADRAFT_67616 [Galerina marginata CBS 339.88]|uniref:Uncharacterized protein n=1 Tax=Galerina marginata (strain CBS 339.88) TaxID=685588 RepID=A0A067SZ30_GALM3|nr:hypothetical protein GALMADRAFT_67616 [Galerina marginata CBS 339.88]